MVKKLNKKNLTLLATVLLLGTWLFLATPTPTVKAIEKSQAHSFGNTHISDIAFVNWTRFWSLFNAHSAWDLEYNEGAGWFSVKEDLQIIKNYTHEWKCKITLNFTASHSADYRLTFAIDVRVKNYAYKEAEYRYVLTYQDYNATFDWSDVAEIPSVIISHGTKNVDGIDYFWWRVRRDNVPLGAHVVIDPSFGYETEGTELGYPTDIIIGSWFTCPENGVADSITIYMDTYGSGPHYFKCAIYQKSDNSLVGSTEQREFGDTDSSWQTFNFSEPKPTLNNIDYWLLVWADSLNALYCGIYRNSQTDKGGNQELTYGTFPNPWNPTSENYIYTIYCNYTFIYWAEADSFVIKNYNYNISDPNWHAPNWLLSFTTEGNVTVDVSDPDCQVAPKRVVVGTDIYQDWSYDVDTDVLSINNVASNVKVYWRLPDEDGGGGGGGGGPAAPIVPAPTPVVPTPGIPLPYLGILILVGVVVTVVAASQLRKSKGWRQAMRAQSKPRRAKWKRSKRKNWRKNK